MNVGAANSESLHVFNSEVVGWGSLKMLKIKPIQKTLFPETIQTHFMYYVSACPSSHEFRTTIKSQIGPRGATLQPKQGEHTIFRHGNIRLCQCSIWYFGDHRSRARPMQRAPKRCNTVKICRNVYLPQAISHCLDIQ
jgi:hypothetical protein